MDISACLTMLAGVRDAATPVVSVYLGTRWADEHQRDRVRLFLKNEVARCRRGAEGAALRHDLDWVEAEGEAITAGARFADAHGVALFACESLGIREALPVRVAFDNAFHVGRTPLLAPLAAAMQESPPALVVFVDGERARIMAVGPDGAAEEVALESEVPGHHSRGGWAQLAQSRYQRHIQDHRDRHLEAVVESVRGLVGERGATRLVMAGDFRTVAALRDRLPAAVARLVVGGVAASRHETASVIVGRATTLLAQAETAEEARRVDGVLTEAAKSGQAVAGLEETLDAVNRGAVHRLFVLKGLRADGRVCGACAALQPGDGERCRVCGAPTSATELGAAMSARVIAAGGATSTLSDHALLARVGGVAAALRYPL